MKQLYGKRKINIKKNLQPYENRTYRFVLPIIKVYGKQLLSLFSSLKKVAVGINDYTAMELGIEYDKHIFILIDVQNTENFDDLLWTIKQHPAYEYDYVFDIYNQLHMIILKMPQKFINVLEHFKSGNYSKMFTKEDLQFFFGGKDWHSVHKEIKPILTKQEAYKPVFEKKIKEEFMIVDLPNIEWKEFDFPPELKEEIFNYEVKNNSSG
jgi:hypothetical protein